MTKFEDQLYVDLMREHGSTLAEITLPDPSRRHVPSQRALLAAGAGALAIAATVSVLVVAGGGSQAPGYALTTNHDGSVTLTVYRISGIAQANAKLRQLGDNVVVVPVRAGCPSIDSLRAPAVQPGGNIAQQAQGAGSSAGSVSLNAHGVPAGDIIVVAAETTPQGGALESALTSPPVPSCVMPNGFGDGPGAVFGSGVGHHPGGAGGSRQPFDAVDGGTGPGQSAGN